MKTNILIYSLLLLLFATGCEKDENYYGELDTDQTGIAENDTEGGMVPKGYFAVNFSPSTFSAMRAAISGQDSRIQHIRYIVYKSTGEFVKEKIVLSTSGPVSWPLAAVRDTLPKGDYKAVFLGNVEKSLFGSTVDVLLNYQTSYSNARIALPPTEFSDRTEYYWANVSFSDAAANVPIMLQRIIGKLDVHRNVIDANDALSMLVNNIVTQINYKNIIQTNLPAILTPLIRGVLTNHLTGGLAIVIDNLLNPLISGLVAPITDALYNLLLQELVSQIELALAVNDPGGGLVYLTRILNPWGYGEGAIVTIDNFPKTINFDLVVQESFPVGQRFYLPIIENVGERYISVKGFNADYNIKKINVLTEGLIADLIVDGIIDNELLLTGIFVDITDPLTATGPKTNFRYMANYSLVDLKLKSYTQQTDGAHSLSLQIKLGDIANLDNIVYNIIHDPVLTAAIHLILNPLNLTPGLSNAYDGTLSAIETAILNITIQLPINVPLLGIENLTISGGWSGVTSY